MTNSDLDAQTREDSAHYLAAAENAARDADALVAKLSTAGLTVVAGIAGLSETGHSSLGVAAVAFAFAAIVSLANQRLGADLLRRLWEKTYQLRSSVEARNQMNPWFVFSLVLNWTAVVSVATGFVAASWFAVQALGGSTP